MLSAEGEEAKSLLRQWLEEFGAAPDFFFEEDIPTTVRMVEQRPLGAIIAYPGVYDDPELLTQVVYDWQLWVEYVSGVVERLYHKDRWVLTSRVRRVVYAQHLTPGRVVSLYPVPDRVIAVTLYQQAE